MARTIIIVKVPFDWHEKLPDHPSVKWDPYEYGDSPDLVLGPNAHYFTEEMLGNPKLLEAALKRARKAKKK